MTLAKEWHIDLYIASHLLLKIVTRKQLLAHINACNQHQIIAGFSRGIFIEECKSLDEYKKKLAGIPGTTLEQYLDLFAGQITPAHIFKDELEAASTTGSVNVSVSSAVDLSLNPSGAPFLPIKRKDLFTMKGAHIWKTVRKNFHSVSKYYRPVVVVDSNPMSRSNRMAKKHQKKPAPVYRACVWCCQSCVTYNLVRVCACIFSF